MSFQLEPVPRCSASSGLFLHLCEIGGIRTHALICIKLLCTSNFCLCLVVFASSAYKSPRERYRRAALGMRERPALIISMPT